MEHDSTSQDSNVNFIGTLGARIDTLEVAIDAYNDGDVNAEFTIRRLAHTVGTPASFLGMDDVFEAALFVQRALPAQLAVAALALIQALRDQAAEKTMLQSRVLIIGGMPQLNEALAELIGTPSRYVVSLDTAEDALKSMDEERASCIILSVVLPDMDSSVFFLGLRENPLTSSIPIIFVGVRLSDQIKELSQLHNADSYCENPSGPEEIVEWVNARLRRAPEALHASRRDALTGLLNQAALREAFTTAQSERTRNNDPLTLACIAVDSARNLLNAFSEDIREEILQTMGMTLSASLRSYDSVSRWGTYEFVVLLPGEDAFGGTRAMENVLEQFRRHCINPSNPAPHDLSVSIGVTQVEIDTECEECISRAEHLVYQATSMGGNRVVSDQSVSRSTRVHRVLILSADKITCDVLTNMLEKNGLPTAAFSTLEEALSADLDAQRFHLVIVDQDFPPAGGFGVLQQLREDEKNNRLPIVMLISENVEENVTKALDLGANDYLIRPFSPNHLVSRIRRLLSRRSTEDVSPETLKLLIVDSDPRSLVLTATILHQRGFQVYLSKSADNAIERYVSVRPDAIIADVSNDPEETQRLAQALPESDDSSAVPFVLLSTPTQTALPELSKSARVMGHIDKPLDPIKLPDQIESLLRLPTSATRFESSLEHLNAEIQSIMQRDN